MYQIALCDDNLKELEKAEKLLGDYEMTHPGLNLVTRRFKHTHELLHMVREESYIPDVIFMDIYMPDGENRSSPMGVNAAKELRNMGYKGRIVFLTVSREYALEAYNVDAVQYLVKPAAEDRLHLLLDSLLKDIDEERRKFILLKIEGTHVRVALNEIVCLEAQGKKQSLQLANGTGYQLRMTMAELSEQLLAYPEFARIGVSFIVNLRYIDSLNMKEIRMKSGTVIRLPRGSYKSLRELYFNYYCKDREGSD